MGQLVLVPGVLSGMCRLCLWDHGQLSEGKVVCLQHSLRDSFVTLFVGAFRAVGPGGKLVRKHLWEGGGVTRAMWASDSGDQPRAVCACLLLRVEVAVWGRSGYVL